MNFLITKPFQFAATFIFILVSSASFTSLQAQDELDEQVPYQGDTLLINPNQVRESADGDIFMDCDWPTMVSMIRDLEERIAGETETDTVYGVYVSGALVGSSLSMWYDCLVLRDSIEALQVAYDEVLVPRVTLDAAVILSDTSAALSASVSGNGVEASGFKWSIEEDGDFTTTGLEEDTGVTSPIKDTVTTLEAGKTHYFTAYATKGGEDLYGDTLSLLTLPGITTGALSAVTDSSATLSATFSADSITAQGFVWGLQADLSDGASVSADTTDGSTAIETELTGLTEGTAHYFSAFATNASGTSYGDTLSFSTLIPLTDSEIHSAVNLWVSNEPLAEKTYGDISEWNTSAVTTTYNLFNGTNFNDDIGSWDVSNVTDMRNMFKGAEYFNQDISGWDVGKVLYMKQMFTGASTFNQDIGGWDVSNVTTISYMFKGASAFNQDIGSWVVSNVTDMSYMFKQNDEFNQDIGSWDVSNVTNMSYMFNLSDEFNQDIGSWDVSLVTDMSGLFAGAYEFNDDIGNWNVSSVTNMTSMFNGADAFNQDLSLWCVTGIDSEPFAFGNSTTPGYNPAWGTCPAAN